MNSIADIIPLCSGPFPSQSQSQQAPPKVSQSQPISDTPDTVIMTQEATQDTVILTQNLESQVLDEDAQDGDRSSPVTGNRSGFLLDSDDESNQGLVEKKKKVAVLSDDSDDEEEKDEEQKDDEEEKEIQYDSDENEILVEKQPKFKGFKGKRG